MTLEVELCGIRLRNPVLAASGTFGYGLEFERHVDLNQLGGFVVKGLSREPIEGNPEPRLYETAAGMMNSVGLQNIGVRAFVQDKLPALAKLLAHNNQQVAAAAANALGRIATADAAKALAGALKRAPDKLKAPVADAYLRCADAMLAAGKKAEAMAIYRTLDDDEWPKPIRLAAKAGMLKAAGKK